MEVAPDLLRQRKRTDIPLRGVIHIGASTCEEINDYRTIGVGKVLWIEGNPDSVSIGRKNVGYDPNQTIIEAFLSHQNGHETFYYTAASDQNNSLMEPCTWYADVRVVDKKVVEVKRLDTLLSEMKMDIKDYNVLVADVQGAELKVLLGCGDILNHIDFIVSEAWYDELYIWGNYIYTKGTPISKLKDFLEDIYGFNETIRIPTDEENPQRTHSWLDVLFERNN